MLPFSYHPLLPWLAPWKLLEHDRVNLSCASVFTAGSDLSANRQALLSWKCAQAAILSQPEKHGKRAIKRYKTLDSGKLVTIPEILTRAGYTYDIVTMNKQEYQQALREKLVEEALEAASTDSQHLITELADLHEVIDALMTSNGITPDDVQAEQERRRTERGGFTQRFRLLKITAPDNTSAT